MSKICYTIKTFNRKHSAVIAKADAILNEYAAAGYEVTLRTLYYQFVARDLLPNKEKSYKYLKGIMGHARLAGMIDWDHMHDATRHLSLLQHYFGPQDGLNKLASWYHVDMWANQRFRPEVWTEKDAVVGLVKRVCEENDVPYFSCRGYTSLTEMWNSSMRLRRWMGDGQQPFIIHFGDHDPSGIDMSRDITDRLQKTFMADCQFRRVALNMDQIEEYQPPPNPAKVTDSRYKAYVAEYGDESWELDALDPPKFRELIEGQLSGLRDEKLWKRDAAEKARVKAQLKEIAQDWEGVALNKRKVAELNEVLDGCNKAIADRDGKITKLQAAVKHLRKRKGKK